MSQDPYQSQPYQSQGQPTGQGLAQGYQQPYSPPQWQQQPYQQPGAQMQQWPPQYQQPPYPQPQISPRSPALALIVSLFLPGVGSMMAGKVGKGVGILLGWLVGWALCLVVIGFLVMPVMWILGLVFAWTDTVAWNRDHGIIS